MTRCPRCGSPDQALHPSVQHGGEVSPCSHSFHRRRTVRVYDGYGPEEVDALRAEIIRLRDEALREGRMTESVVLSHAIALVSALRQEVWP